MRTFEKNERVHATAAMASLHQMHTPMVRFDVVLRLSMNAVMPNASSLEYATEGEGFDEGLRLWHAACQEQWHSTHRMADAESALQMWH